MKTFKTLILLAAIMLAPMAMSSQPKKDVGRDVMNQILNQSRDGNRSGNRGGNRGNSTPAPSKPNSRAGKVNEMSYDEFVKRFPGIKGDGKSVVVVDIGADWCVYCRKLEPVMDELAVKYKGRVQFYRIDSGKYPEIKTLLGFSGIPHVLIFPKNGEPLECGGFPSKGDPVAIYSERIESKM